MKLADVIAKNAWRVGVSLPSVVQVVEINDRTPFVDGKPPATDYKRYHFNKSEVRTIAEYEDRFAELLKTGYSWLNVEFMGMYKDTYIVAVVVPSSITGAGERRQLYPGYATSTNFSGHGSTAKGNAGWNLEIV